MEDQVLPAITVALDRIGADVHRRSGSVFYSGRSAFSRPTALYLLGLNPGGSPERQAAETVDVDIDQFRTQAADWSAYADERWEGRAPGTCGMQPRVLHMLARLGLDPRQVPASNVVFVRSRNEAGLQAEKQHLLASCWPVHATVIASLGVRTVVCFGGTAGRWTRERMNAHDPIDRFCETNLRGWTSYAHRAPDGRVVATLTHPSRADWTNPAADPTPLVARMLTRET
jgi:hypothetical protein